MIKDIVKDEEFLKQPSEPATLDDLDVMQDLIDTMKSMGDNCACLAANQIGALKNIIVYEFNSKLYVMFNPVIKQGIVPYKATEGCMSLEYDTESRRYKRITVEYDSLENGQLVKRTRKLSDWNAQIVQHAIDHCNGILV
ncbi:MAG: peptide deformylase [Eggerthellaceae bacterium]|nr:peptide deformylase [Eggerthellaceae bacterium]